MVEMSSDSIGILFVSLMIFILLCSIGGSCYNADPEETDRRNFAREILRGNTTIENVANDNNFDPSHVEEWVNEYTQLAIKYAVDAEKHTHEIELKEQDLKWFEQVCEKYIGPDWKTITDFNNRRI